MKNNKHLFVVAAGTLLEYYDYALYGFYGLSLVNNFLPNKSHNLLYAFMVFAGGWVGKLIGAMYFGYLGDTKGRAFALRINMLGVVVPTFIISVLPSYQRIGITASLTLIVCRIIQGIFVGAEFNGAAIYIYESVDSKNKNFANSLLSSLSIAGFLLASLVALVLSHFEKIVDSWRLAFLLGSLAGGLLLIFRDRLGESRQFIYSKQSNDNTHTKENAFTNTLSLLLKNYKISIVSAVVCGSSSAIFYFIFIFLPNYSKLLQLSNSTFAINPGSVTHAMLFYALCLPVFGKISNKIGTKQFMYLGLVLSIISILLWFDMAFSNKNPIFFYYLAAMVAPIQSSVGMRWILDRINLSYRYRCLGVSHTLGSLIFSASMPYFATLSWKYSKNFWAPAFCIIFLCTLNLIVLVWADTSLNNKYAPVVN